MASWVSRQPLLVANYDFVLGGGEVGLRLLVTALVDRGHTPTIAVPGTTPLTGAGHEVSIPATTAGGALALADLARGCDLVHVFSIRMALTAILARTGKPLVLHALITEPDPFDPVVARFADAIVVNSQATARRFAPGQARVIYNGVPIPRSVREPLTDLTPGRRTIGIIGNLCPRKGQLDALPALEEVMAARDDVDVACAGYVEGPIAMALRDRAATSGGRLRLLGFVPDIADHLAEFALILVPSRSEGFGRVAVEALRAGVPVLATRVEGLIEALRDLDDPWLPDARDQWAGRILRELDTPTHMPEQLRAAARRFDPGRYVDEILDCYDGVLARHAANGRTRCSQEPRGLRKLHI
jgi:glycosyltransferase involved in cell wall biosynthesis